MTAPERPAYVPVKWKKLCITGRIVVDCESKEANKKEIYYLDSTNAWSLVSNRLLDKSYQDDVELMTAGTGTK